MTTDNCVLYGYMQPTCNDSQYILETHKRKNVPH